MRPERLEILIRALRARVGHGDEWILWLEGRRLPPDLEGLAASGANPPPEVLERGTVWPRSVLTPIRCSSPTLDALAGAVSNHALPEIADHVHVTDAGGWLLSLYDVGGDDPPSMSPRLPAEFRRALEPTAPQ